MSTIAFNLDPYFNYVERSPANHNGNPAVSRTAIEEMKAERDDALRTLERTDLTEQKRNEFKFWIARVEKWLAEVEEEDHAFDQRCIELKWQSCHSPSSS